MHRSLPRTQLLLLLPRRLSPVEVDCRAHLYHVLIISAFLVILASCVCLFSSSFLLFARRRWRARTQNLFFFFFSLIIYFFTRRGPSPDHTCRCQTFYVFHSFCLQCTPCILCRLYSGL